jgi:hypothetical protein
MTVPSPAKPGRPTESLTFLYDVDNTLLNNDQLKADIDTRLFSLLGDRWSDLFWTIYEDVRHQEDVVDIPEAVHRFQQECHDQAVCSGVADAFQQIDFRHYVYPGALDALAYTATLGTNVIVSDGDPVFQCRKIEESGLAAAAGGHVLIYIHKEQHVAEITGQFPADHYVIVDDKPRILKAMPPLFGPRLVTVFVCQGHYAHDPGGRTDFSPALTLGSIRDIHDYPLAEFLSGAFHKQGACPIRAS